MRSLNISLLSFLTLVGGPITQVYPAPDGALSAVVLITSRRDDEGPPGRCPTTQSENGSWRG